MRAILEGIFKGFIQWIYGLCLEIVQYIANSLLNVFQMDLDYFRQVAPVTDDILSIVIAVGWALLLGNLVFQATKSMATGLGFEGEDPKLLFTRTFVFGFLLLASQQICDIGLGISAQVISLLQVPSSVTITIPDENNFDLGASWLLIIIVGFVIMWQFVKLCFEVAERYVVTAILVLLSPLAFGMGGSKNTEDIFKGWCRMFGSMCVMMVMNVIFLKLLISALGYMPSGVAVLPWMLLIVGIARVARKIDGIITRMGLNPAITGDGLGRGLPGMVTYAVVKGIGNSIAKAAGNSAGGKHAKSGGSGSGYSGPRTNPYAPPPPPPPPPSAPPSGGGPGGAAAPAASFVAGQQAGTQAESYSTVQSGAFAARQATQDPTIQTDPGLPENGRIAAMDSSAGRPGDSKSPTVHTHGARRSSVPPEVRAGGQAAKSYTAAFNRAEGINEEGTMGRMDHPGERDRTPRPSITMSARGTGGAPSPDGTVSRTGTRMSLAAAGMAVDKRDEHTSHESTHETVRDRPSLQQDRTPKIPQPPGVGGGESGKPHASSEIPPSRVTSRDVGIGASATGVKPTRPPVGGQRPVEGNAASGTAGTQTTLVDTGHSGINSPSGGMAGTRPVVSGSAPSVTEVRMTGTAGSDSTVPTRQSARGTERVAPGAAGAAHPSSGHAGPPSGTAGSMPVPGREFPAAGAGMSSTGTAGTRRPSGSGTPQMKPQTPPPATAGTAPKGTKEPPQTNQGTRRMKSGMPPPMQGGTGQSSKRRRKRSEP